MLDTRMRYWAVQYFLRAEVHAIPDQQQKQACPEPALLRQPSAQDAQSEWSVFALRRVKSKFLAVLLVE